MKIKVGDKTVTIRKWKGKDKKKFIQALNKKDLSEQEIMQSLVYSCIEEDVILSIDEFRYVLSRIRAYSLGEEIEIEFLCHECHAIHKQKFNLKDIITFTYKPLKEIKVSDVTIKLSDIKNKEIYIERIAEDETFDLLLRVDSFNADNSFTLESLVDKFDDLDVDVLTEIMEIFESSKFTVNDMNVVTCPDCKDEVIYKFDELPGFFPASWFE